jgi:hypothetical protein
MESEEIAMTGPFTDPAEALQQVQAARAHMAERYTRGAWLYDVFYSLLVGGLVGAAALPAPQNLVAEGVLVVSLLVLAYWWKGRTGMWLSGVAPQRARWVAIGLGVVIMTLAFVNLWWSTRGEPSWLSAAAAVAGTILAFIGSRIWTAVYRRESGLPR